MNIIGIKWDKKNIIYCTYYEPRRHNNSTVDLLFRSTYILFMKYTLIGWVKSFVHSPGAQQAVQLPVGCGETSDLLLWGTFHYSDRTTEDWLPGTCVCQSGQTVSFCLSVCLLSGGPDLGKIQKFDQSGTIWAQIWHHGLILLHFAFQIVNLLRLQLSSVIFGHQFNKYTVELA